jgi:chromosomal replication initiation ATPase DnaA
MSNQSEEKRRFVTCRCQVCNGAIEFDANELDGRETAKVECPHCGMEATLYEPTQKVPPIISEYQLRSSSDVEREEFLCENNVEQFRTVETAEQTLSETERLTPTQFSEFLGQNRVKARLELAIAAANSRGEPLPHVLLVGAAGLGKTVLASDVQFPRAFVRQFLLF